MTLAFKLKKIREDIAQLKKKQHTLINVQKHFMKCCECGKYFKKVPSLSSASATRMPDFPKDELPFSAFT